MNPFARLTLSFFVFLAISSSVLAETIRYEKGERRDPFIPLVGPEGIVDIRQFDASGINVEGIIHDPHGESLVLINGEFYKQGDPVKNANIISIFKDRVVLGQSDEEKTIWIREEIVNAGIAGSEAIPTSSQSAKPAKIAKPKKLAKPKPKSS